MRTTTTSQPRNPRSQPLSEISTEPGAVQPWLPPGSTRWSCVSVRTDVRTTNPKPQVKKLVVDLGVHPEALRGWIRQAEADAGERDDRLTTDERAELAALRKENTQLKRANDVLRAASALFAAQLDPTRPR
ncbi:transposase [Streptomyces sp. NPDC056656]|uniref:transposase n=1 Tax=Streptomyces sp. NPDC056656 TaxID=3345895 RepID=UPI0036A290D2